MVPDIRALAADIEGTLTDKSGRRTSPALLRRLRALDRSGVQILLCSGRGVEYQRGLRRRWGLSPDAPLVAENGCCYVLGGVVRTTYDPGEFNRGAILRRLIAAGAGELGELDPDKEHSITIYPRGFLSGRSYSDEDIKRIYRFLRKTLRGVRCRVFQTSASGEVLPPGVDKSVALEALLRGAGIPLSSVLYIGDGQNDIPAARLVRRGGGLVGAPANAVEKMRGLASYCARRAFHGGAVETLDHFFGAMDSAARELAPAPRRWAGESREARKR
ncbi:MAG: HAD family hydrolase [Thermoplasmatota archaeon]